MAIPPADPGPATLRVPAGDTLPADYPIVLYFPERTESDLSSARYSLDLYRDGVWAEVSEKEGGSGELWLRPQSRGFESGEEIVVTLDGNQHTFTVTDRLERETPPPITVRIYATQFAPRGIETEDGAEANYHAVAVVTFDAPGALRVQIRADGTQERGVLNAGVPLLLGWYGADPTAQPTSSARFNWRDLVSGVGDYSDVQLQALKCYRGPFSDRPRTAAAWEALPDGGCLDEAPAPEPDPEPEGCALLSSPMAASPAHWLARFLVRR